MSLLKHVEGDGLMRCHENLTPINRGQDCNTGSMARWMDARSMALRLEHASTSGKYVRIVSAAARKRSIDANQEGTRAPFYIDDEVAMFVFRQLTVSMSLMSSSDVRTCSSKWKPLLVCVVERHPVGLRRSFGKRRHQTWATSAAEFIWLFSHEIGWKSLL